MKGFLLFGFDTYYPSGGEEDFEGAFTTASEAKRAVLDLQADFGQIYDVASETWSDVFDVEKVKVALREQRALLTPAQSAVD